MSIASQRQNQIAFHPQFLSFFPTKFAFRHRQLEPKLILKQISLCFALQDDCGGDLGDLLALIIAY